MERACTGDHAAFAVLYDRYAPLVRSICFESTADLNAAQDLAQEVFLRAYGRLSTMREPDKFGAWVCGIARLTSREWQRQERRDRLEFTGDLPFAISTSDQRMEMDECLENLQSAMAELDEQERFALNAFYLQRKSVSAARNVLQMSQSGFYKLLRRAKRKLERALQSRDLAD